LWIIILKTKAYRSDCVTFFYQPKRIVFILTRLDILGGIPLKFEHRHLTKCLQNSHHNELPQVSSLLEKMAEDFTRYGKKKVDQRKKTLKRIE